MAAVWMLMATGISRRRLGSVMLSVVVIAIAAAGLSASIAMRAHGPEAVDTAFAAANGPDLVAATDASGVDELRAALARPEVRSVAEPVPTIDAQLRRPDRSIEIDIRAMVDTRATVNAPQIVSGRVPSGRGEGLLDAAVAEQVGVRVGDTAAVSAGGSVHQLHVVGLAYDFTDCFYPTCDPGHVWVLPATFDDVSGAAEPVLLTAIDLVDPDDATGVVTDLEAALGERLLGSNDWMDTRGDLLVEIEFFGAFLAAFGVFVLFGSAIVIGAAITARTAARRRTLAICKAQGFSNAQLTTSIVLEHMAIATAGSLLGSIAAALMSPRLRIGSLRTLEGGGVSWSATPFVASLVAVWTIVLVATLVPAWRAGRADVVDGLVVRPAGRGRAGGLAGAVPATVQLGLRSAVARPLRAVLAASAVALAVVAAIVTISIDRSVDRILERPELAGDPYDVIVEPFDRATAADVEAALAATPSVDGWYSLADDRAIVDGSQVHVRAVGGDLDAADYVIGDGRAIEARGEAIAGYGLMSSNGWAIGDRVDADIDGTTLELTLVGWYRETEDSGEILQIALDDLGAARPDVAVVYAVDAVADVPPAELGHALERAVGHQARIVVNQSDSAQVRPFRIAMTTMTLLIAAIVVAHLAAMTLTAARQRAPRASVLRAVGMANRQLATEALVHAGVVAAFGTTVGLALGWQARRAVGDLLTSALGSGPGVTIAPSGAQIAAIIVAAVAGSAMLSGSIEAAVRAGDAQRR